MLVVRPDEACQRENKPDWAGMTRKELTMISDLFLVVATAAVLSVYTVIGRLAIPPEDRVPLHELGWDGWWHTLRRSLVFLGDGAPSAGTRSR